MRKGRIEAFSDGVIAILITIMVLELKPPTGSGWREALDRYPIFLAYALSFVNLGIYWNNHHHMFAGVRRVTAGVMWANLHLLFWLSLIPFLTAWVGEFPRATAPTVAYGVGLLMSALAYAILFGVLRKVQPSDAPIHAEPNARRKVVLSNVLYAIGVVASPVAAWMGQLLYLAVALIWLVPNREIERAVEALEGDHLG